jgi:hypothetical protein
MGQIRAGLEDLAQVVAGLVVNMGQIRAGLASLT